MTRNPRRIAQLVLIAALLLTPALYQPVASATPQEVRCTNGFWVEGFAAGYYTENLAQQAACASASSNCHEQGGWPNPGCQVVTHGWNASSHEWCIAKVCCVYSGDR